MATQLLNAKVILRRKQVQARVGISRSGIYELMKTGKFPHSIKLSARSVGWLESDIESFIAEKIAASRI